MTYENEDTIETLHERVTALQTAVAGMHKAFNPRTDRPGYDYADANDNIAGDEARIIFKDALKAVFEVTQMSRERHADTTAESSANWFIKKLSSAVCANHERAERSTTITTRERTLMNYVIDLQQHDIPKLRKKISGESLQASIVSLFDINVHALEQHPFTNYMPETCLYLHNRKQTAVITDEFFDKFRSEYLYLSAEQQREIRDAIPEIYEQFAYLQAVESLSNMCGIMRNEWRKIEGIYPNTEIKKTL